MQSKLFSLQQSLWAQVYPQSHSKLVQYVLYSPFSLHRANNHQTEAMEEGADVIAMETVAPDRTDSLSNDHEVDQYGLEPVDGQGRQEAEVNVDSTPRPPPLGVPIVTTSRGEATRSCVSDVVFEEQPKATGVCEHMVGGGSQDVCVHVCSENTINATCTLYIHLRLVFVSVPLSVCLCTQPCTRPLPKKFMFSSIAEEVSG